MYKASAFIGGTSLADGLKELEICSPMDGAVVGTVPILSQGHVDEAFRAAHEAFVNWSQLDYHTRVKFLLAFASKIKEHLPTLSNIIHMETGKSFLGASEEVNRSYDYIIESVHAYSDMMSKLEEYDHDNNILMPKNFHATYVRIPLGTVLTISPFNYPVNLLITKVVPALLVGNAVVHKSATNGSLSGWYVAKLFHEVSVDGFLATPGVFNYLTGRGSEIGKWFDRTRKIDAFSFTGSSDVGKAIVDRLPTRIPLQLELGGHNPAVVLEDVDLDLAVRQIVKGAFGFSGQRCTSIKRVLVHGRVHDAFVEKLKKALSELKLEEPLISAGSVRMFVEFCEDAEQKGAVLVSNKLEVRGNYVSPMVFTRVREGMKIYEEEVFAPILAISLYEREEEIFSFCNGSKYGLQASIFGKDIESITGFALKLEFGRVNINIAPSRSPDVLPFGGCKDSGFGLQSIGESLKFFTAKRGIVLEKEINE